MNLNTDDSDHPDPPADRQKVKGHKKDELKHIVKEEAVKLYEAKEAEFPEPEQIRELERVVLLKVHRQQMDGSHR